MDENTPDGERDELAALKMLTPEAVAKVLDVPTRTVHLLCQRGDIPGARKCGRRWRVPRWGIERYINQGREEPPKVTAEAAPAPAPEVSDPSPARAFPPDPERRVAGKSRPTVSADEKTRRAEIRRMLRDKAGG